MISTFIKIFLEIDHKPVANAGVGGIIQLPDDSVVLNGNQSVDDWGIQSYQWSIVPGSPVVDMEVTIS